jgi:hypothetical protein
MNKEQRDAFVKKVEAAWFTRAKAQELDNPKHMKYLRAELEFFMGVITALNILDETPRDPETLSHDVPVIWIINAMSGQSIARIEKEKKA